MAYFGHAETCLDGPSAFLTGVTDLDIVWVDGAPLLYISTVLGGGVSVRSLNAGMAMVGAYELPASTELSAPIQTQVLTVAGEAYLATFGRADVGLRGFGMNANGTLLPQAVLSGPTSEAFSALEAIEIGGRSFLVTGSLNERGLTSWDLTATGQLVQVSQIAGGSVPQGVDVSALAQVRIGADTYVMVASMVDNSVASYRLSDLGMLTKASLIGADQGLGITAPSVLKIASIAGNTFAFVGAAGSSSISVLQLGTGGAMKATDHVIDSLGTRFQTISALEVVEISGRIFVIAGGGDDGLSLLTLLPNGRLLHLESISDTLTTALTNVSAIATVWTGGTLQVFAAGSGEAGISRFVVDLGLLAPPVIGTSGAETLTGGAWGDLISGGGGNDAIYGGAGEDILMDGAGADTLYGGAGADTFVMLADQTADVIGDFNIVEDRLDLSAWGLLYDVSALTITSRSYGATIRFGTETLTIYSSAGVSLTAAAFTNNHIVNLSHSPVLAEAALVALHGTEAADTLTGGFDNDTLSGLGGDDWLYGNEGDDYLDGGSGGDLIFGGLGQDLIYGGPENDTVDAGQGNDTVFGGDGNDSLSGGEGADILWGEAGADTLVGGAEDDALTGGDGNDVLFGGFGHDTLLGGAGNDQIFIDAALDVVDGGAGTDRVRFETSAGLDIALSAYTSVERIDGGSGNDTLDGTGVYSPMTILGGAGADILTGTPVADYIYGGTGNDVLYGGGQQDFLFGDAGADTIHGGTGNDQIYVDDGGDVVLGGDGTDRVRVANPAGVTLTLTGWTSVERIDGDAGADAIDASGFFNALTMVGNAGNDRLTGGSANDVIFGNEGDDFLTGGGGVDVLVGGAGADTLSGGAGDDVFFLDQDGDIILGGDGLDRARFENGISGISLSLAGWSGLERLTATPGNDTIDGSSQTGALVINGNTGNDVIIGGTGSDLLFGNDGADTLYGGDGADFLYGDAGADTFYGGGGDDFFYLDQVGDRVADGGAGVDRAVLTKAGISIAVNTTWVGLERIDGAAGGETINATGYGLALMMLGNGGADVLIGGLGGDTIFGNAGADRLDGGAGGNDVLLGGTEADVFLFRTGSGSDRINDWEAGLDKMDLSGIAGASGFGDILVNQSSGLNTVISAGDVTITLQGFVGMIDAGDFLF